MAGAAPRVTYRVRSASGDVAIEASGATVGAVLVELGRGLSHVQTAGSPLEARQRRLFRLEPPTTDLPGLAVAFVNELIFLFDTEGFLLAGGELHLDKAGTAQRIEGVLFGDRFDPQRHQYGTEVKAATYHEAVLKEERKGARGRLVLDL